MNEPTCITCGCTSLRACPGGCYWLGVNPRDGTGVCSCCSKSLAGWKQQQADARGAHAVDHHDGQQRIQIGPTDI